MLCFPLQMVECTYVVVLYACLLMNIFIFSWYHCYWVYIRRKRAVHVCPHDLFEQNRKHLSRAGRFMKVVQHYMILS